MKRNIILAIIVTSIFASCGGGSKPLNDNSTQEDNSSDIRILETNTTEEIEDNITTEKENNDVIIEQNTTDNTEDNISIENNTTEDNITEEEITIPSENTPNISGNIYIGDGEPQEAKITQKDFEDANLTLTIKDEYSLTNVSNFLFTLNIDDFDKDAIKRLKQFIALGISIDSNQTQCQESNTIPFVIEDYKNACIIGVNEDNLDKINMALDSLNIKDTRDIKYALAEMDRLNIRDNDIQIVETKPIIIDSNDTNNTNQTAPIIASFTPNEYTNGGFIGINSSNVDDMNNFLTNQLHLSTLSKLEDIVKRAYQYNISVDLICDNPNANLENNLTVEGYRFACISTNNTENLTSLAIDLNLTNTKEIRDIYQTAYAIGIDLAPPPLPVECPKDSAERIYIKKTGQTNIFEPYDDGYYQSGVTPCYERKDLGDDKGIVTDKIRGLMWQDSKEIVRKAWNTKRPCIFRATIGYTEYSDKNKTKIIHVVTEDEVCDILYTKGDTAHNYCQNLELGGYDDWRLPYATELIDISNYQNPLWEGYTMLREAIDEPFKYTRDSGYWARDHYRGFHVDMAWYVTARTGGLYRGYQDIELNVRCVRGDSYLIATDYNTDQYGTNDYSYTTYDNYTHLSNGIIQDNIRQVEWFLNTPTTIPLNWKDSVSYCKNSAKDGGRWRLPNTKEMTTIVDTKKYLPAFKKEFQSYAGVSSFFSSTTVSSTPGNENQAFVHESQTGGINHSAKDVASNNFCIRNINIK